MTGDSGEHTLNSIVITARGGILYTYSFFKIILKKRHCVLKTCVVRGCEKLETLKKFNLQNGLTPPSPAPPRMGHYGARHFTLHWGAQQFYQA
jgi:hypothetical protein